MHPVRTIAVLPDHLIDHIAAGEVVERPASAAKELVENALDSGADQIDVRLEGGGLTLLSVTDNGCGMSPEDARCALLRHATSKLTDLNDLATVSTLGFRGEALSSLAAVSRLSLVTRQAEAKAGFAIEVVAGEVLSAELCGAPIGTTITIRDLFFNTPARRKFMRAPATEQAHVTESLLRVMLGARRGSLVVSNQGRRLLDVGQTHDLLERLRQGLGQRLSKLVPLCGQDPQVAVSGALMVPDAARPGGRGLWCFVNGRYVRDRMLTRAVAEGAAALGMHVTPAGFIYIDLAAQAIDVNVHPQKLEVRFSAPHAVYQAVVTAVAQAADQCMSEAAAAYPTAQQASHSPVAADHEPHAAHEAVHSRRMSTQLAVKHFAMRQTSLAAPGHATWQARHNSPVSGHEMDAAAGAEGAPKVVDAPYQLPEEEQKLAGLPLCTAKFDSRWSTLEPLGEAPRGYLACRDGEKLALIDVGLALRAIFVDQLKADADQANLVGKRLLMPPSFVPEDHLAAAADDYVIETAERPSPWAVGLEAVGPGRFVIVQAADLGQVSPHIQVRALLETLSATRVGCHTSWAECRQQTALSWAEAMAKYCSTPWQQSGEGTLGMRHWLLTLGRAQLPYSKPWVRHIFP